MVHVVNDWDALLNIYTRFSLYLFYIFFIVDITHIHFLASPIGDCGIKI